MIAADLFLEKIEMKLYKIPFGVWSILFLLVCLERLPAQSFVPAIPSIVDLELRSQIALGSPDRLRKWTEQKLATANSNNNSTSIQCVNIAAKDSVPLSTMCIPLLNKQNYSRPKNPK